MCGGESYILETLLKFLRQAITAWVVWPFFFFFLDFVWESQSCSLCSPSPWKLINWELAAPNEVTWISELPYHCVDLQNQDLRLVCLRNFSLKWCNPGFWGPFPGSWKDVGRKSVRTGGCKAQDTAQL